MKVKVSVEKTMRFSRTCTGVFEIECEDPDTAKKQVDLLICSNKIQTTDIKWNEPIYEESSFLTTGDVLSV